MDIAHDALIAKINAVIGDGLFTEQEMNDVNTLISTYGTELGDYSKVAQEANVDIAVKNAQQAVELMTQEQVFNKLTDNGNIQGLFMDNGQLYVNGEYINTRNFKAVTDDGEQTFLIDADGNVHLNVKSFTLEGKTITEVYDQTLTQEKVFNVLTDNGNTQGIYLQNGQLYINGEYIVRNIDTNMTLSNQMIADAIELTSDSSTMRLSSTYKAIFAKKPRVIPRSPPKCEVMYSIASGVICTIPAEADNSFRINVANVRASSV